MEMSAAYMAQTVEHLRKAGGFEVQTTHEDKTRDGEPVFHRVLHRCHHANGDELLLETITYPGGREAYHLAVTKIGAMSSFSYPLDSWKFRPTTVEFKYAIHPESGLGLSFILTLQAPPEVKADTNPGS
jgi:hypothetical protein